MCISRMHVNGCKAFASEEFHACLHWPCKSRMRTYGLTVDLELNWKGGVVHLIHIFVYASSPHPGSMDSGHCNMHDYGQAPKLTVCHQSFSHLLADPSYCHSRRW